MIDTHDQHPPSRFTMMSFEGIGDEARGTGWERHIGRHAITPHTEHCPTIRTERPTTP